MSRRITHNHNRDGIDRRGFLECMAAGRGMIILLLCLYLAAAAPAQEPRATLLGTVEDSSGERVPSADVSLIRKDTSFERREKKDNAGEFRFDLLLQGSYRLEVARSRSITRFIDAASEVGKPITGCRLPVAHFIFQLW